VGWRTVAAALDAGTATCAAINAAYFLDRLLSGADVSTAKRLAVGVLALASLASLFEGVALLTLAVRAGDMSTATAPWAAIRFLVFAGGAGITALVVRRWWLR
jgi:hypothetical protein